MYILYYAKGGSIVIILLEVDTRYTLLQGHYTLLQGHAILRDMIPLCVVFGIGDRLLVFSFGPHVSLLHATPSMICFSLYLLKSPNPFCGDGVRSEYASTTPRG